MMQKLISLVRTWWKIVLLYTALTAAYGCLAIARSCYYVLSCRWWRDHRRHHGYDGLHHNRCPRHHHPSMQMKFQEDYH